MAKLIDISSTEEDHKAKDNFLVDLKKMIQTANLNFLIGAGCSVPAIPLLGNIENEIQAYLDASKEEEANKLILDFLLPLLQATHNLVSMTDADAKGTISNYKSFLLNISKILIDRKNNLLPKKANVFSTNYDLFIEKSFEEISASTSAQLSDGFKRSPSLSGSFHFSPSEFFNSIYNNGSLYNYKVEIPSVNLVKLHGSLSWQSNNQRILFSVNRLEDLFQKCSALASTKIPADIKKFIQEFSVVLPKKDKFRDTLLNQTYYDLLRFYANELEKENTLLIAEGFSFADEHILEITKRALKNPTLTLVIFSFDEKANQLYSQKFDSFKNVHIAYSSTANIDFKNFNILVEGTK